MGQEGEGGLVVWASTALSHREGRLFEINVQSISDLAGKYALLSLVTSTQNKRGTHFFLQTVIKDSYPWLNPYFTQPSGPAPHASRRAHGAHTY